MGAIAVGAGVSAAGSLASAGIGAAASGSAASKAAASTQLGIEAQQAQYQGNQQTLAPYIDYGENADALLNNYLSNSYNLGNSLTEQGLQQTPGYQFTLDQGLQATQNSAAARGLGVSGAALKGAASYATGLADNTYQQQFQDQLSLNQNTYNQLLQASQQGLSAANALAGVGTSTGSGVANSYNTLGQTQAAGTVGTANSLTSGLTGAANSVSSNLLLQNLLNNGNSGIYGTYSGTDLSQYGNTVGGGYLVQ